VKHDRLLLGGEVAIEVTHQLAEPLRELRERLGLVVDHLERYVATSTGPTPYPWRSLQTLRHDLAETYLELTQLTRRVDELDRALAPGEPHPFELSPAVDLGLRLAGHELGAGIELLFDLGHTTPPRGVPGTLALLVAQLVAVSAQSARAIAGSSLSVRVTEEDGWAVVTIADNGDGSDRIHELRELARSIVGPWGGTVDAASAPGRGCSFELRLAI
jgi:signal transduction histidine kinase